MKEKTLHVVLAEDAGDEVTVAESSVYRREFRRSEEPFEVTEKEWKSLQPTGRFELVNEEEENKHAV